MTNVLTTSSLTKTTTSRVRALRSGEVLRHHDGAGSGYWALEPYEGCEFGCPFCAASEGNEPGVIEARTNASEAVARALRQGQLAGTPLVLGARTEPWQPVEKAAAITRSALDVLARWGDGVELRAQTRSTLVTRDLDLLTSLARKARVSVSFSVPTVDLGLARLLEPQVPSPDRRLVAMEVLARAGIRVGVLVSPVVYGFNDGAASLEGLLRRAREAGASYATVAPLSMTEREVRAHVQTVERTDPELARRYERMLGAAIARGPAARDRLEADFSQVCDRIGLVHAWRRRAAEPAKRVVEVDESSRQLRLF